MAKSKSSYCQYKKNWMHVYSPIKRNSETLNITDTYKYLGITLDTHHNYKIHVENLTKQLKQKMFVYSKIRSHITKSTSATYLNAIILSTLSFCLPLLPHIQHWTQLYNYIIEHIRFMLIFISAHITVMHSRNQMLYILKTTANYWQWKLIFKSNTMTLLL